MSDEQTPAAAAVAKVTDPTTVAGTELKNGTDPNEVWARKEKQLRRQQQAMQQEKQAWEAKQKGYETDYTPKARIKEDPISVLMEAGLTHEEIYQRLLNSTPSNDPTIKAMTDKIKALEEKLNGAAKQAEEATTAQYQQALKQIDREVKLMTDSDPEFESIKAAGLHSAVTELIEATYKQEGYLMDVKEAAKEVENHLVEQAMKMAGLSKVKARMQPAAETAATTPQKQPQQSGVKTLTNQMQANSSGRSSEKERIARAMAAFKGQG